MNIIILSVHELKYLPGPPGGVPGLKLHLPLIQGCPPGHCPLNGHGMPEYNRNDST